MSYLFVGDRGPLPLTLLVFAGVPCVCLLFASGCHCCYHCLAVTAAASGCSDRRALVGTSKNLPPLLRTIIRTRPALSKRQPGETMQQSFRSATAFGSSVNLSPRAFVFSFYRDRSRSSALHVQLIAEGIQTYLVLTLTSGSIEARKQSAMADCSV